MNRTFTRIGAGIGALSVAAMMTSTPALAAIADGTWGAWSADDPTSVFDGRLAFGDPTVGGADFTYTENSGSTGYGYIESVNDKGDWLTAETPVGAIFGANGPSDVENEIILDTSDASNSTFTIDFDNPVPANELAVVIVDIDSNGQSELTESDRVLVEATGADDADLTSAELNGDVFNSCDVAVDANMPDSCGGSVITSVPTQSEPTATSVKFIGDLTQNDDGQTGWINPTVATKSVTLTWDSNDTGSSIRVFVAVKNHGGLASTGFDATAGMLSALTLGALGVAAVAATRRRSL